MRPNNYLSPSPSLTSDSKSSQLKPTHHHHQEAPQKHHLATKSSRMLTSADSRCSGSVLLFSHPAYPPFEAFACHISDKHYQSHIALIDGHHGCVYLRAPLSLSYLAPLGHA
ncbi:hypothetical protein HAX54_004163 [Datura stramonium]|uniref:Uncharacterized protein n=1 Tax=Datura stramonium TaxID=4076 RepID=A0ABS8RX30_DATST|nr:hypothetical protein [Datura stramonium]